MSGVAIVVTDAAVVALREVAGSWGAMLSDGRQLPDGRWEILVDDDVHLALARIAEDPSDAIFAVLTKQLGRA